MNGFAGTECADRTVTRPWRSGPSRVTGIGEAKPHREAFPGGRQVRGKTRPVDQSAGQATTGCLAMPAHRAAYRCAGQATGNWQGTLTVRMVDQTARWPSDGESSSQRGQRQLFVQPVADRPAHHAPGEQVDDDGETQPTLARPDVGQILLAKSELLEQTAG